MLKRYRPPVLAVIGLIISAEAQAEVVRHDAKSHSAVQQGQAKPKADAPPSIPVAVQYDIHRAARALDAANDQKPSSTDERNAKAQEDVAWWTPGLFFLGTVEMFLTSAGVFLVWRTLEASWAAQREAKRAADAAEKALAADRPHVYPMPIQSNLRAYFGGITNEANIRFRVQNVGKAPARIVHFIVSANPVSREGEMPGSQYRQEVRTYALGSGDYFEMDINIANSITARDDLNVSLRRNYRLLHISPWVSYLDPNGEVHDTTETWRFFMEGTPDELRRVKGDGDRNT
jgi:hypothetical protein